MRKKVYRNVCSVLSNNVDYRGSKIEIQLIIVDDGSTDNTMNLLNKYFSTDPRVLIISQKNQGVAVARENGLQHVAGDYIAFCDSDDWVDEDWLISMYSVLKSYDADIVSYRARIAGRQINYNPEELFVWDRKAAIKEFLIHKRLNGTLWTNLFKVDLFEGIHFNPNLTCFEDGDVMWRMLNRVNKVVKVNDAKYHWNVSDTSLSNGKMNESRLKSGLLFLKKVMTDVENMATNEFQEIAESLCKKWLYGDLKSMFRHDLFNSKIESYILKELRHHPLKTIKSVNRPLEQFFCVLAMVCPSLARKFFKIVMH